MSSAKNRKTKGNAGKASQAAGATVTPPEVCQGEEAQPETTTPEAVEAAPHALYAPPTDGPQPKAGQGGVVEPDASSAELPEILPDAGTAPAKPANDLPPSLEHTEDKPIPADELVVDGASVEQPAGESTAAVQTGEVVPQTETPKAKAKRSRKAKKPEANSQGKKLSALDAAAKVLGKTGQAMTCKEMIAAMASKGYWTSPGGKTPDATLYAAILREMQTKGEQARFIKAERGKFALKTAK